MIIGNFLSKILPDSNEFVVERLALVLTRSMVGFSAALVCTLLMLAMLYFEAILPSAGLTLGLAGLVAVLYPMPILLLRWQMKSKTLQISNRQKATNFFYAVLAIVIVWNIIAAAILPHISGSTRIVIICLYIATVYAHFLPLAPFPKQSFILALVNLLPLSFLLMMQGDPDIFPLGIAGAVLTIKEIMVIHFFNRMDAERFHWNGMAASDSEPDMSELGAQRQRVDSFFSLGVHSLVIQIVVGFFLVLFVRSTDTDAVLWQWFAVLTTLQTIRSISHSVYHFSPNRFSLKQWQWIAGVNVVLSQVGWLLFMVNFHFNQQLVNIETAVLIQVVVALVSFVGLGANRTFLYLNSACCLITPLLITINSFDAWMVVALLAVFITTILVGLENYHQLTLRSLESVQLRLLAEYRAEEMKTLNKEMHVLNLDLTQAREHLTEVNSSLETQVKERTRELQYQAEHDMLTGLSNRYRFVKVVDEALQLQQQQTSAKFAIYMIDLNRFKEINDGLGHFAGDRVLQATAIRLRASCAPHHSCARWGGDEFVVLQRNVTDESDIVAFANKLLNNLRQTIQLEGGQVLVDASVGVSICPDHGGSAPVLLEHADIALYRAKCADNQAAKNHLAVYQASWGSAAAKRLHLAQELRQAIETGELEVALQPFINSQDEELVGFEARARWRKPGGIQVSPADFIPLAEECRLMPDLGSYILREACESLISLAPDSDLRVAVNVSVSQLLDPEFQKQVLLTLSELELSPNRLELEITENVFAGNVEQIKAVLSDLKNRGIRIAIDDFGTGYSSISYLQHFPVDTLKIDRSFVSALNDGGEPLYCSILSLAHSLELHTIVEGVETNEEYRKVLTLGGDEIQGYYFSKPMFLEEAREWLQQLSSPIKQAAER